MNIEAGAVKHALHAAHDPADPPVVPRRGPSRARSRNVTEPPSEAGAGAAGGGATACSGRETGRGNESGSGGGGRPSEHPHGVRCRRCGRPIILLYGPDAGLVRERAEALLGFRGRRSQRSLLAGEARRRRALRPNRRRLVDEAIGDSAVRRPARDPRPCRLAQFASGVDTLARSPVKDCRIVIEAGELRPESPLRKACERAKTAVAIGCYPDGERDLARLIDDESGCRICALPPTPAPPCCRCSAATTTPATN